MSDDADFIPEDKWWDRLPRELQYLKPAALAYRKGPGVQDIEAFVKSITQADLAIYTETYRSIVRQEDNWRICAWLDNCQPEDKRHGVWWFVFCMMLIFEHLAKRRIDPFSSREVRMFDTRPRVPLDWSKLPNNLMYLSRPAEQYGKYQFANEVEAFIGRCTFEERQELEALAARIRDGGDMARISAWLDQYDMTKHQEAALVYFLLGLMDAMELGI